MSCATVLERRPGPAPGFFVVHRVGNECRLVHATSVVVPAMLVIAVIAAVLLH